MPHLIAVCEVKPKNGRTYIQDYSLDSHVTHHANADTDKGHYSCPPFNIPPCLPDNTIPTHSDSCLLEIKLKERDQMLFGCINPTPTISLSSYWLFLSDSVKFETISTFNGSTFSAATS